MRAFLVAVVASFSLPLAEDNMTAIAAPPPAEARLVTWPAPKPIAASPLYEVAVNARPVFVYPCQVGDILDAKGNPIPDPPETTNPKPAAFCCFDFEGGPVKVEVTVKQASGHLPLRSAVVRPARQGIAAAADGGKITFTLPRPGKLSVEPNGSAAAPLFIFAGRPEKNPPQPKDPNTIYYGPGEHVIGWKEIKSNTTVYIAGGAVVRGHLIVGRSENVRILGRGILDCGKSPRKHDAAKTNEFGRYGVASQIGYCRNVLLEGICLIDPPSWTVQIMHSQDVTCRDLKIITWRENGDGIDVCTSQRVVVEDCFLRTWDDALVVKAHLLPRQGVKGKSVLAEWTKEDLERFTPGLVRDVTFRDCVVWLDRAHALEIGQETAATEITDVLFKDIDVIHDFHLCAIDIGSGDRARVHNIRYEGVRIEDPRSARLFMFISKPNYWSVDNKMGVDCRPIENVVLKDIEVLGPKIPPSLMEGRRLDRKQEGVKVDNITFQNLRFGGKRVADERQADLRKVGLVGKVTFSP